MKEVYYIYNNEALASCIFLSILNKVGELDTARACLVLPFLLDDRTVNLIERKQESDLNLENVTKEEPRLFVSFNKRYLSLLPVAINALMVLSKSNQIIIGSTITNHSNVAFADNELGNRFLKIERVIPKFLDLIQKYPTAQLYRILNIQL